MKYRNIPLRLKLLACNALSDWSNVCDTSDIYANASLIPGALVTQPTNIDIDPAPTRLPTDLKPYFYDLFIKTYFNSTQAPIYYNGNVLIKFKCLTSTSKLMLHVGDRIVINEQSIELKSLTDSQFKPIRRLEWRYERQAQMLVADFNRPAFVAKQSYSLAIGFGVRVPPVAENGSSEGKYGLYADSYVDSNGIHKWMMGSRMEPTHSRQAFPCFDEPAMKAKFRLRVVHDSSLLALSNMPTKSSTNMYVLCSQTFLYVIFVSLHSC